jgi:putative addiction module component (TIGR02574 family)
MSTLQEIEVHALKLPDTQRAKLAAQLLHSLPPVLVDEDDGVAEALRRDAELDANPSQGLSPEAFRKAVLAARKR